MENKYNEKTPVVKGERIFSATLTAAILAVILVVNILVYVLNANLGIFYAVPKEKDETAISGATDDLFEEAVRKGAKIEISFCMSKDDIQLHDTGKFVHKTATEYQKRYPELIELNYINLITKQDKDGKNVADELNSYLEAGKELRTHSVIFRCEDNYRVLTDVYTGTGFVDFFTLDSSGSAIAYDGEEVMAGAMAWVLTDEKDRRNAYLTVGHYEQIDPAFAKLIELAGYDSKTVDLSAEAVPDDCDLLIISTPRNDFETSREGSTIPYALTECGRLEAYLERGGSLYVSLDPYVKALPELEGILEECGIALSESEVEGSTVRDIVRDFGSSVSPDGYSIITRHAKGDISEAIADKVNKYSDDDVILNYAGALALSGTAKPLLLSSGSSVCEDGGVTTRTGGDFAVAAYNRLSYGEGTKEATVFVNSSLYLTVSSALVTNGYANKDFVYAVFEELFGAKNLPYGCNTVLYDTQTLENLTMGTATLYTVIALAVPVALLAVGVVVIIKRRNR